MGGTPADAPDVLTTAFMAEYQQTRESLWS